MEKEINWNEYANAYDLMCEYNPSYFELMRVISNSVQSLFSKNENNISMYDYCSGTGNIFLSILDKNPNISKIYSLEKNPGFIHKQKDKIKTRNLEEKVNILEDDILAHKPIEKVDLCCLIHGFNFFQEDQRSKILHTIDSTLKVGGYFIISDIGREIKVEEWEKYMFNHLAQKFGNETKAHEEMEKIKNPSEQNRIAQENQQKGLAYMHDLPEFISYLRDFGFEKVVSARNDLYRGIDDFVIIEKTSNL